MKIETQSGGMHLTEELRRHVTQRLHFAFDRVTAHIRRVLVKITDINGPRGGADKRCVLRVQLARHPEVVVADTRSDLYAAVGHASERAAQAVQRRLARQRRRREYLE